jgi:hypothetical protein
LATVWSDSSIKSTRASCMLTENILGLHQSMLFFP